MKKIWKYGLTGMILALVLAVLLPFGTDAREADGTGEAGWKTVDGNRYYINENGEMELGLTKIDGQQYYFSMEKDTLGQMQTGWVKIKGKKYFFGTGKKTKGRMQTGRVLTLADGQYFVKKSGVMASNEVVKLPSGKYAYFKADGKRLVKSAKLTVKGKTYISDKKGFLYHDKLIRFKGTYYYTKQNAVVRVLPDQKAAKVAARLKGDLKAAYLYARNLSYWGYRKFKKSWGTKKLAEYGITHHRGNCYVYAAVFRDIAYAMGYDAHQIGGFVKLRGGNGFHSWVEIEKDGKILVYDPEHSHWQEDEDASFGFEYGTKGTYIYLNYKRMN